MLVDDLKEAYFGASICWQARSFRSAGLATGTFEIYDQVTSVFPLPSTQQISSLHAIQMTTRLKCDRRLPKPEWRFRIVLCVAAISQATTSRWVEGAEGASDTRLPARCILERGKYVSHRDESGF